jgi:pimeloyl-ACP methyl ester carboxylesterase
MPSAKRTPQRKTATQKGSAVDAPLEIVDPRWLIRALALSLGAALLCAYLTACLLFYQGLWQLVLHPGHAVDRSPANIGIGFTPVRFGDFDTGQPHLTGWWIPSSQTAAATPDRLNTAPPSFTSRFTVLYLHDGSGSLADTLPMLELLHHTGFNVFAIDYRGFGASDASKHPDAERMQQDADAALDYLITTRHIPLGSIIAMGSGLGASLAVQVARAHTELPAVILDNADPNPAATAAAQSSHLIPVRLLFGDRFTIAAPLAKLSTPKLLLAEGAIVSSADRSRLEALYRKAASPKDVVLLPPEPPDPVREDAVRRFLDEYLPRR